MKKIIGAVMVMLMTGCATPPPVSEIPEAVRQGFWAAHDAAHVGDFAKTERYLDATAPLVPPPKVRLKFTVNMTIKPVPNGQSVTTKVSVLPQDAPPSALMFDDTNLWSTPGAVAEMKDMTLFENKTAPAQQQLDAKQKADAIKQVQADKVDMAKESGAKWKWAVLSPIILFVMAFIGYLAWKFKWFGL